MLRFTTGQLTGVERRLKPEIGHFEHTHLGVGTAHLESEPVLFVFKTPVTDVDLSVTLDFYFKYTTAGSDEAGYGLDHLALRCEPLQTEYDNYRLFTRKWQIRMNCLPLKTSLEIPITTPTSF
jgi:hypothetical protein